MKDPIDTILSVALLIICITLAAWAMFAMRCLCK